MANCIKKFEIGINVGTYIMLSLKVTLFRTQLTHVPPPSRTIANSYYDEIIVQKARITLSL